jgi:hypothetical protein
MVLISIFAMSLSTLPSTSLPSRALALATFMHLASLVSAHPHHGNGGNSDAPIDAILWIHILVQLVVWGGVFGVGMVLGIVR